MNVFLNFVKFLIILFFIPFFILIILISPIIKIRFGKINSSRIGHFASNTALYYLKDKQNKKKISLDIFYCQNIISNQYLLKLWKKKLIIFPRVLIFPFWNFFYYYIKSKKFITGIYEYGDRDIDKLLQINKIIFRLNNKEIAFGLDVLKSMNVDHNKVILLYNRDSLFLKKNFSFDSSYHDFRNSNIENYILAAEEITKRGYYVIRAGRDVEKKIATKNKKIINYADSKFQNDFMDIFLHYICKFVISNGQGLDSLAKIFKKPILFVNYLPLASITTFDYKSMIIIKKFFNKDNNCYIPISKIFNMGIADAYDAKLYQEKNIKIIENSEEEIRYATIEMFEYVINNKRLKFTDNQKKFWDIYYEGLINNNINIHHPNKKEVNIRISEDFLNKNKYLLN